MTTREIQGHLLEIYGLGVSPDLISTVTDAVLETVGEWQNRPLEASVGSVTRSDCFGSRANESHSRRSVGGRWASKPSTSAQFLVRADAAEPSRESEGEGDGYR
jgi:hypothetical protein